jgi:outer membrane protein
VNAQRSELIKERIAIDNLKITLNQLMGQKVDNPFEVSDTIAFNYKPAYDELRNAASKNNNSLAVAQHSIAVAEYSKREINALRLPQIGVNANYIFARTQNQVGFVLLNQNLGFNTGFTASWTLFNGLKNRTSYKNAQLQQYIAQTQYNQAQNTVDASILKAWYNLQAVNELLKLEEESILLARENVAVAMERFKLGNGTSIEVMTAQNSLTDAYNRLISARYDAKSAEIELMRINGGLVK